MIMQSIYVHIHILPHKLSRLSYVCLSTCPDVCLAMWTHRSIKARDTKFDLKVVCDAHRPRKSNNFLKSILSEVLKKQLSDFDMYYTFPPLNYNPTGQ